MIRQSGEGGFCGARGVCDLRQSGRGCGAISGVDPLRPLGLVKIEWQPCGGKGTHAARDSKAQRFVQARQWMSTDVIRWRVLLSIS